MSGETENSSNFEKAEMNCEKTRPSNTQQFAKLTNDSKSNVKFRCNEMIKFEKQSSKPKNRTPAAPGEFHCVQYLTLIYFLDMCRWWTYSAWWILFRMCSLRWKKRLPPMTGACVGLCTLLLRSVSEKYVSTSNIANFSAVCCFQVYLSCSCSRANCCALLFSFSRPQTLASTYLWVKPFFIVFSADMASGLSWLVPLTGE